MNKMNKKISALLLGLLLVLPLLCQQKKGTRVEEHQVKIAMIKRFFDFIKWPPAAGNSDPGKFVIGIVGDTPLSDYIETLSSQIIIPEKKIAFKLITDLAQVKECCVLIIGSIDAERLKEVLSVTGDLPILSISETEGFAEIGVLINLFKIDNNVKFEINYQSVRRSGLVFSSKLYKLAKLIDFPR
ncbi:MAG: YfiR family protein [Candidatus Aminicenantes bacterium]|nr:YfiR family protein [Candidatus Aminicenantes bacterium]